MLTHTQHHCAWLISVVALVLCGVGCAQTQTLHEMATFPMEQYGLDLFPTRAGFMTVDGNEFSMHDWSDGHVLWNATAVTGRSWGQPDSAWRTPNNATFALSWSGRYFAVAIPGDHAVAVQRWHDGKPDGNCRVFSSRAVLAQAYYRLAIRDDGLILLQRSTARDRTPSGQLLAIDGDQVVARGALPGTAHLLPGAALAVSGELYAVQVTVGKITVRKVASKVPVTIPLDGDLRLADDGALYTPAGRILPPDAGRKHGYRDRQSCGAIPSGWLAFDGQDGLHHALSLTTGETWSCTSDSTSRAVAISADGRVMLLHREVEAGKVDAIELYERPGKLCASMHYAPEELVPFEGTDDQRKVGQRCTDWILSPDGRSVLLKFQYMHIGGEVKLYRW